MGLVGGDINQEQLDREKVKNIQLEEDSSVGKNVNKGDDSTVHGIITNVVSSIEHEDAKESEEKDDVDGTADSGDEDKDDDDGAADSDDEGVKEDVNDDDDDKESGDETDGTENEEENEETDVNEDEAEDGDDDDESDVNENDDENKDENDNENEENDEEVNDDESSDDVEDSGDGSDTSDDVYSADEVYSAEESSDEQLKKKGKPQLMKNLAKMVQKNKEPATKQPVKQTRKRKQQQHDGSAIRSSKRNKAGGGTATFKRMERATGKRKADIQKVDDTNDQHDDENEDEETNEDEQVKVKSKKKRPLNKKPSIPAKKGSKLPGLRPRAVPAQLVDTIRSLSKRQIKVVREMGFGKILTITIDKIPAKLGYYVVDKFNPKTMRIEIEKDKHIEVTEEVIHQLLGLPTGGVEVNVADPKNGFVGIQDEWRKMYKQEKISPANIALRIKNNPDDDGPLFEIDFAMLVLSTLVRIQAQGKCRLNIVHQLDDNVTVRNIDWCRAIVDYTKTCKDEALSKFTGPVTILLMLYVDRLVSESYDVERNENPLSFWTATRLSEREEAEMEGSGFGKGVLQELYMDLTNYNNVNMDDVGDHNIEEDDDHGDQPHNVESGNAVVRDKDGIKNDDKQNDDSESENASVQNKQDVYDMLNKMLDSLVKKRDKFEAALMDATKQMPGDEELNAIAARYEKFQNDGVNTRNEQEEWSQFFEVNADSIEKDVVDKKEALKKKAAMQDPSFDLGIDDDATMENMYENLTERDIPDDEVVGQPLTDKETNIVEKSVEGDKANIQTSNQASTDTMAEIAVESVAEGGRTSGQITNQPSTVTDGVKGKATIQSDPKPATETDVFCMPVDINTSLNENETVLWRYFQHIMDDKDKCSMKKSTQEEKEVNETDKLFMRKIFTTQYGAEITALNLESLTMKKEVLAEVIDCWGAVLNYKEKMKEGGQPKRLFLYPTTIPFWMFNKKENKKQMVKSFEKMLLMVVEGFEDKMGLQSYDVLIVPIAEDRHYYMMAFDLVDESVVLIDNMKKSIIKIIDDPVFQKKSMACKVKYLIASYLSYVKHPKAKAIENAKVIRTHVPWATTKNATDCGIFLMRHMEMYTGAGDPFECGFICDEKHIGVQIKNLRMKYVVHLMGAENNYYRDDVLADALNHLEQSGGSAESKKLTKQLQAHGNAVKKVTNMIEMQNMS